MLVERTSDGDSQRLTFELPEPTATRPSLLPYLIPKGYVTIDGASLTITGVDDAKRRFSIMLIQHTQEKTDNAVKRYPGKKYQTNDPANAYKKKRSRLMPPRLPMPAYCCECRVLNRAQRTRFEGQTEK